MGEVQTLSDEKLQASAANYLLEGNEREVALLLLSCTLSASEPRAAESHGYGQAYDDDWYIDIVLRGSRAAYDALRDPVDNPVYASLQEALAAVLPSGVYLGAIIVRAQTVDIGPHWRREYEEAASGRTMQNQVVPTETVRIWNGMRFLSESEVRIARALDATGVLFLPNPIARLGRSGRENRSPDFLVCQAGKWGILEVDGEPFHPPSRTVHDHERDRSFRSHGIKVVEHFDSAACYQRPEEVVGKFLQILEQS